MVMHPIKPELNGKPMLDTKDPAGKPLFAEMVRVVKAETSGFVGYLWPKPGSDTAVDKLSYVKGDNGWQWIIGTGIYTDDLDAAFWRQLLVDLLIAGLVIGVLIYISTRVMYSIVDPLKKVQRSIERAELNGDLSQRVEIDQQDEVGRMAASFNSLMSRLQLTITEVNEVMEAVAKGDFSRRVEADLDGDLDTLKQRMNGSSEIIDNSMSEVLLVMQSLQQGDFKSAPDLNGFNGAFRETLEMAIRTMATLDGAIVAICQVMFCGIPWKFLSADYQRSSWAVG